MAIGSRKVCCINKTKYSKVPASQETRIFIGILFFRLASSLLDGMSVINAWLRNGIHLFFCSLDFDYVCCWKFCTADPGGRAVYGRSLAGIVGSNPAGGIDVSCKCCMLSDIGLCAWPITRREGSYRVW